MQDEEISKIIKALDESVAKAVELNVNGKIRKIDEKLDNYIKADLEWKKTADPYIKIASNISGTWKFIIYIAGGILAIIGIRKELN